MRVLIAAIIILLTIAVGAWWDFSLWQECRADHSFSYCARVLGR